MNRPRHPKGTNEGGQFAQKHAPESKRTLGTSSPNDTGSNTITSDADNIEDTAMTADSPAPNASTRKLYPFRNEVSDMLGVASAAVRSTISHIGDRINRR